VSKLLLKELSRYKPGTWAEVLYRHSFYVSEEVALLYKGEKLTFAEFNLLVNRLVQALNALGAKKGDVIGNFSWNCLEQVIVLGAAMKGGFIFSPFNPRLQAKDIENLIKYSTAEVLFVGPEMITQVQEMRPRLEKVKHFVTFE
jgi:long-chain acyl-CoA synthetase